MFSLVSCESSVRLIVSPSVTPCLQHFGFADIWRKGWMNSSDSIHVYLISCFLSFSVSS